MLLNMLPALTVNDCTDGMVRNPVLRCKFGPTRCTSRVTATDFSHVISRQFSVCMTFAARGLFWLCYVSMAIARRCAPLLRHVFHVVGMCPQEKMIRPDASSIVTVVANKGIIRDDTIGQFVGDAVCKYGSSSGRTRPDRKRSIAARPNMGTPNPTLARGIDMRPKTSSDRLRLASSWGIVGGHRSSPFGVMPPAVSAARGLFVSPHYTMFTASQCAICTRRQRV
jgi:hypothetical protein